MPRTWLGCPYLWAGVRLKLWTMFGCALSVVRLRARPNPPGFEALAGGIAYGLAQGYLDLAGRSGSRPSRFGNP